MNHYAQVLVVALLLTVATTVSAQERVLQDIPPGEDRITEVRKGEAAPYDGQLFDHPTALRWANWLIQYQLLLQVDGEYQRKVCKAEIDYRNQLIALEQEKYQQVTHDYQGQLAIRDAQISQLRMELEHPKWYRSVWFGVTAGVVATGVAVSAGYLLSK
jgi:hypothetical protein